MLGHLGSLHFKKAPCVSSFFLLFLHQPKVQPENSQQTCPEFQPGPSLVVPLQACYFISFEIVFSSVKWAYSNLPQRLLGGLGGVKCRKHLVQCPDTAETQQAAAFTPITLWFGRRGMLNEEVLPILGAESAKIFSAKILGP